MNKMNQTQTRSPRKRLLSLILAVILMIGLLPISAFATSASAQAGEDKAATQDSEFLRIFHLDCGRKYFTVSEIKGIIDQLAENHYTHIQLAFGNDGLRFLLDDMSVTVNGTEYESDAVKTAIQSGNSGNGLAGAAAGVLTQSDMDAIIAYANKSGIKVIPMFNAPGHMYTAVNAMNTLGVGGKYIKVSSPGDGRTFNWAVNPTDATAVAFAEALLQKYVTYFAGKGSTMFNIGADESGLSSSNYASYAEMVNGMNAIVKAAGMTTLAYNDGIYNTAYAKSQPDVTFDSDIVICYWTAGANSASVETLLTKKFKILNNTDDWYYVLGDALYGIWSSAQWGYKDALSGIENTPVTQMKNYTGNEKPMGSILCVWCDVPSYSYTGYGEVATTQTNQQSVYNLIKAMAESNPDYFTDKVKLSASDDATGVSVAVTGAKGQKATVEVKKITSDFPFDTEAHVSYNVTPAVDGKAYTGEGTVTLPVPEGWATEDSRIRAYIIDNDAVKLISGTLSGGKYTFQVPHFSEMGLVQLAEGAPSKTENITLTVGGTKTISVDGVQKIVTAPNGQYATAATTTIPAESKSYSATASAKIAAYTEAYENYNASNLIDGNTSTFYWSNGAQTAGAYAQVDLGAAIPFDTVRVTSPSNVGDDYCVNAAVQVSVDGSEWTDIGSYTGNKAAAQSFANTLGSARYIRVLIKNARNNWWKLAEIEWGNTQNGQFTRMAASGTVTVPERTSISFTGVAVGNTTAVIGDTQYNITVNGRVEIPISIIDYRADGLLFDWNYLQGTYSNSYRYGLVHGKSGSNGYVVATKDSTTGLYTVDGNDSAVEQIAGTKIEQTGPVNSAYGTTFYTGNLDNSWSRAGLVQEKLGANGMPVYTDAAVKYVASLLKAGYYNEMSGNCNSVIYDTFVAESGSRSIRNTSTTEFSAQFEVTKSYANISNAYDLAWYLLNTIYQADTNMTTVTGTGTKEHSIPIYGMAVDTYKSIILTPNEDGTTYSFEAGYQVKDSHGNVTFDYPAHIKYDQTAGTIYEDASEEKSYAFYPLDGLGYEQSGLLTDTSAIDSKHNGNFTLRGESQFVYKEASNLYFQFTGDDDVYMYINGVLALDLGGAHGRNSKTVNLNDLDATKYGLKEGQVATFTFFYMERCSDASTFGIETNMELVQRDIDVQKKAYDTNYANEILNNMSAPTGTTVAYDLILTNKSNSVMDQIKFTDTDDCEATVSFGYGVDSPGIAAGTVTKANGSVTLGQLDSYVIYVTEGENESEVANTRQTLTSLDALSKAVAKTKLLPGQSLHVRFLTATFDVNSSTILSYRNTVAATASVGGTSLSDTASHELYSYNANDTGRTYVVDFGLPLKITNIFSVAPSNIGDVQLSSSNTLKYGTVILTGTGANVELVYTRTADKTIDNAETIVLDVVYKMGNSNVSLQKTLTIIPASNVYYEDSLASFTNGSGVAKDATWSTVDNDGNENATEKTDVYQALQQLGDKKIYGYDDAYNKDNSSMLSMGTAHKVTVTSAMADTNAWKEQPTSAWPTASFTFTGTGFDVISLTNNKSGAIFVDVYAGGEATGEPVKTLVVNNYYGYTNENGQWVVKENASDTLYQIPVLKVDGLDHGEYTAVITVIYNSFFDKTTERQYSFWLDAIRVYNPMGGYADYTKDNEGYPQYIKLHDELVKTNKGVVFIDGAANASIADYANFGPNNEVYLANGQAISFKLTGNTNEIASIQIGAKAPDGKSASMVVNDDEKNAVPLKTATEMYYDITEQAKNGQLVTITNKSDGILSLTNLKITYRTSGKTVTLSDLTAKDQANAVAMVQALFAAPVEVFQPDPFQASWGRAVRAGKRATLTVKTSADVESITVDGVTVSSYTTRTERTGWGWWSPKATYRVFTYTTTAPAQTTDYAVCAVNAEGTASEPITATLTVKAATWWNWWF